MAKGWLRRKKGSTLFCWRNAEGMERSRSLGSADMADNEAWAKVGELKLDKLVAQSDPLQITFGELAEKYLARYPFKKQSTKDLQEQVIRNVLLPRWSDTEAIGIDAPRLKSWFVSLDISNPTRGKYRAMMSRLYAWAQSEELIPEFIAGKDGGFQSSNPCSRVKGPKFSQETAYEALALEVKDTFALLSELQRPEYEIALLVATCGLRISEALGLRWRNVLWEHGRIAIQQTFVHGAIQQGAKTKLSRGRVEVPQLVLAALASWRNETSYAGDEDFLFPSIKLGGRKPRTATMLVQDYIRPAALRAGILVERDGKLYSNEGDEVPRFGFHNLGRHSLASFLMDNQENPALVQAVMRHAQMDMTLYYSHSNRKAKRAAMENYAQQLTPGLVAGASAGAVKLLPEGQVL
jgi:integrase